MDKNKNKIRIRKLKIVIPSKPIDIPKKPDSPLLNSNSFYNKYNFSLPKYGSFKNNSEMKYSEGSDIPNDTPPDSFNDDVNKMVFLEKFADEILKSKKLND